MRLPTDSSATSSFRFDGSSSYVNLASGVGMSKNADYSVSFWYRNEGRYTPNGILFSNGNSGSANQEFWIRVVTSGTQRKIAIALKDDTGALRMTNVTSTSCFSGTQWNHFLWTDSSGAGKLYINGVLDATSYAYTQGANTFTFNTTSIGAGVLSTVQSYNAGLMYDTRVYNRVITSAEATNLAQGKEIDSTSLALRWIGNQNGGATVLDSSGNGRNGTFTGQFYVRDSPFYPLRKEVSENLIYNGDFEIYPKSDNVPTTTSGRAIDGTAGGSSSSNLNAVGWWTNISGSCAGYIDRTVSHSGNASLKVSTTATSSWGEFHRFPGGASLSKLKQFYCSVKPNTSYTLTYWMKTNYVSGDSNNGATLVAKEYDPGGSAVTTWTQNLVKTTQDWTKYTATATTSSTCAYLDVYAYVAGHSGTGTLIMDAWFDDISLVETTSVTRTTAANRISIRDFGTSLYFNGSSRVVNDTVATTGIGGALPSELTMAVWQKSYYTGQRTLISFGNSADNNPYALIDIGFSAKQARFTIRNSGGGGNTASSAGLNMTDNQWHHIVGVKDANGIYLYIDGVLINSSTPLTSGTYSYDKFAVGVLSRISVSNGALGNIDNARVYTRALSAREVADMYFKGITPTNGLVVKYDFNEGSGSTALDSSVNGYNGTITSATYSTDVPISARLSA